MWAITLASQTASIASDGTGSGFVVAMFTFDGSNFTHVDTLPKGEHAEFPDDGAAVLQTVNSSNISSQNAAYYRDLSTRYQNSPTAMSHPVKVESEFGSNNYILVIGDHQFDDRNPAAQAPGTYVEYPSEINACRGMVEIYQYKVN